MKPMDAIRDRLKKLPVATTDSNVLRDLPGSIVDNVLEEFVPGAGILDTVCLICKHTVNYEMRMILTQPQGCGSINALQTPLITGSLTTNDHQHCSNSN
jgi:hypothetical protein